MAAHGSRPNAPVGVPLTQTPSPIADLLARRFQIQIALEALERDLQRRGRAAGREPAMVATAQELDHHGALVASLQRVEQRLADLGIVPPG